MKSPGFSNMSTDRCSRSQLAAGKSRESMIRKLFVGSKSASWCPGMSTRSKEPMIRPARCVRRPSRGQRIPLRFGDQGIPGIATGVEDRLISVPDAGAEPVAAQILLDVLCRVQLRRVGWKWQEAD